jgi:hypothetical protein
VLLRPPVDARQLAGGDGVPGERPLHLAPRGARAGRERRIERIDEEAVAVLLSARRTGPAVAQPTEIVLPFNRPRRHPAAGRCPGLQSGHARGQVPGQPVDEPVGIRVVDHNREGGRPRGRALPAERRRAVGAVAGVLGRDHPAVGEGRARDRQAGRGPGQVERLAAAAGRGEKRGGGEGAERQPGPDGSHRGITPGVKGTPDGPAPVACAPRTRQPGAAGGRCDARCEPAGVLTPAPAGKGYTPAAPAAGAHGVPVCRSGQEGAHGSR